jgi:hypothetical protein
MARTPATAPAPHAARSAADTATTPDPAPVAPAAGGSPAAAVLAALSADPAGAAVAAVAARAGISVPAARQALLACEKNGTATRVKGSRPGIADTWQPATPEALPAEAPPADAPGSSTSDDGQPAAEPAGASQPAPVTADATAGDQQADAGPEPGPDPAVTAEAAGTIAAIAQAAEAAGTIAAIAQAADEARQALDAGNLDVALAALEAARELAAQGRRVLKAAASGRRAPATRPGALRDLVEEHLRKFPGTAFTPTRSARRSPGRPGRSPTPSTSWSASGSRRWSPTSPAPTGSAPPPPPRTQPAAPPPARSRRSAPRNAGAGNSARPGRQPDGAPAAPLHPESRPSPLACGSRPGISAR